MLRWQDSDDYRITNTVRGVARELGLTMNLMRMSGANNIFDLCPAGGDAVARIVIAYHGGMVDFLVNGARSQRNEGTYLRDVPIADGTALDSAIQQVRERLEEFAPAPAPGMAS